MKLTVTPALQAKPQVFFDRHELRRILSVYGKNVSIGEWRDYALDALEDRAVFSIFRNTSENPLYQIEKRPKGTRNGRYLVRSSNGAVLRQGDDLERVIALLLPRKLGLVRADWRLA